MAQPNPSNKLSGTRNLKLLITTLSLTTTLSGWALLSLNRPQPTDASAVTAADVAVAQPTPDATEPPQVILPSLSSLPVRGLRVVGNPAAAPQTGGQIVVVQPPAGQPARVSAPAPKPQPVAQTKGSHP